MSFDLEMSVKPARFNPYGIHCGVSRPDVVSHQWTTPEWRFLLITQLESTSSHVCPDWRPCLASTRLYFSIYCSSFATNSFFLCYPVPQNSVHWKWGVSQQTIWFLFHPQSPSLAYPPHFRNWFKMSKISFKITPWSLEASASIFI